MRVRLDSALDRTQISSSENLYTHDYFYTRLRCTVERYSLNRSPNILNSSPLVCIEIQGVPDVRSAFVPSKNCTYKRDELASMHLNIINPHVGLFGL